MKCGASQKEAEQLGYDSAICDSNDSIDIGNDRMEQVRMSESFANADEVFGTLDDDDLELVSDGKGQDIREDGDAFSYQEL